MLVLLDFQAGFNQANAVADIEEGGRIVIRFFANRFLDLIRDIFDKPAWIMFDGGMYGTAARMSKHHHQLGAKMPGGILNAAKLVIVYDVSGNPYGKKIPDRSVKNPFRDHAGIGTADDDCIRFLAIAGKMLQEL